MLILYFFIFFFDFLIYILFCFSAQILPMCWAHKNGKCKRGMSCPSMHIATPSAAALDEARQRAASTIQPVRLSTHSYLNVDFH
jgi:hypothetical protein